MYNAAVKTGNHKNWNAFRKNNKILKKYIIIQKYSHTHTQKNPDDIVKYFIKQKQDNIFSDV